MPRIGRAVAAGFPHHVIQRGNNREGVFFERDDRKQYLSLLKKYAAKWAALVVAGIGRATNSSMPATLLREDGFHDLPCVMTLSSPTMVSANQVPRLDWRDNCVKLYR